MQFILAILASPVFSAIGEVLAPIVAALVKAFATMPEKTETTEDAPHALEHFQSPDYFDARADMLLGLPLATHGNSNGTRSLSAGSGMFKRLVMGGDRSTYSRGR
jgi:hypothetical protein